MSDAQLIGARARAATRAIAGALLVVLLGFTQAASAAITLGADDRFVIAVPMAAGCPISETESASPSAPHADFDATVGVEYLGARQQSEVSEARMYAIGFAEANILCASSASSSFVVEFSVDVPTAYAATGYAGGIDGFGVVSLVGPSGFVFEEHHNAGTAVVDASGTLAPGDYALTATANDVALGAYFEIELLLGPPPAVPALSVTAAVGLTVGMIGLAAQRIAARA